MRHADLPETTIHPIILTAKATVVKILIEHTHRVLLHPGAATVTATLAQNFHIIKLRTTLRGISRNCLQCQVKFARPAQQLMGDLPKVRLTPANVFSNVGIDYAGPVYSTQGRGATAVKRYLGIFVCMATKPFRGSSRRLFHGSIPGSTRSVFLKKRTPQPHIFRSWQ